jgi:hypothetical protein
MPRKAKLPETESGHAKRPDFSIPPPEAKHHDVAAQYYEEAARHHRQAAKLYSSTRHEKASRHAHLAYGHHLHVEQQAEEAARAHIKNALDDSHLEITLVESPRKKRAEKKR